MKDVEKDLAKLGKDGEGEAEDLSDVDIGLEKIDEELIAAQERYQCAISYQRLKVRVETVRASVAANKGVGNVDAVTKFEKESQTLTEQMMHCLRGIKTIDKEYPKAKVRMKLIAERGRQV